MSEAVVARGLGVGSFGTAALKAAALLWFVVAVIGQWAFVYYIAAFYGPTLSGNFAAWDQNEMLIDGHIAGDAVGNLFFLVHVSMAAVLTFGGALQLVPQIRSRAMVFHRWNGRVFMLAALAGAIGGLYLVWVRGTSDGLLGALAITLNAVLIISFAGLAWRAVRRKDIAAHQRWAMRTYLVVNGVWFLRVGMMAWAIATQSASMEAFLALWSFGCYLLPLVVYEAYLRTKSGAGAFGRLAMAGGLFGLTALMSAGIIGAFLFMWRPLL